MRVRFQEPVWNFQVSIIAIYKDFLKKKKKKKKKNKLIFKAFQNFQKLENYQKSE